MYCTVKQLIEHNRLFQILNDRLKSNTFFEADLYEEIVQYVNRYFHIKQVSLSEVEKTYLDFIKSYNKDVKVFMETNKYPFELEEQVKRNLDRTSYDIVLLLSVVFTPHRFRIMQLLKEKLADKSALVIGCGPGLEISQIESEDVDAYDLSIDEGLKILNPSVKFYEKLFDGKSTKKYNQILLIEILEHLSNPVDLLSICRNSLEKDGCLHLTTATNIPQFDHLYNFDTNHIEFEQRIENLGLEVVYVEDIEHEYLTANPNSKNRYYILKQTKND